MRASHRDIAPARVAAAFALPLVSLASLWAPSAEARARLDPAVERPGCATGPAVPIEGATALADAVRRCEAGACTGEAFTLRYAGPEGVQKTELRLQPPEPFQVVRSSTDDGVWFVRLLHPERIQDPCVAIELDPPVKPQLEIEALPSDDPDPRSLHVPRLVHGLVAFAANSVMWQLGPENNVATLIPWGAAALVWFPVTFTSLERRHKPPSIDSVDGIDRLGFSAMAALSTGLMWALAGRDDPTAFAVFGAAFNVCMGISVAQW
jgi:hypothetical protein